MGKINGGLFSSKRPDWGTPLDLYEALDAEFQFQLDAAAWDWNALAPVWFTIFDDALTLDWYWVLTEILDVPPVAFLNPPYGSVIGNFVAKAAMEAEKGVTTATLLPARTDTAWFQDWVFRAAEIRFIRGRLRFVGATSSAPFPSCVAVFRPGYEGPLPRLRMMEKINGRWMTC